MADCSFSLALCNENKCFSTIYYVLVGYENLGIQLSDTGKSKVKKKPEAHPLIIKLLLLLWLLYKNYINYYYTATPQLYIRCIAALLKLIMYIIPDQDDSYTLPHMMHTTA